MNVDGKFSMLAEMSARIAEIHLILVTSSTRQNISKIETPNQSL
jgi:hypothetical protein